MALYRTILPIHFNEYFCFCWCHRCHRYNKWATFQIGSWIHMDFHFWFYCLQIYWPVLPITIWPKIKGVTTAHRNEPKFKVEATRIQDQYNCHSIWFHWAQYVYIKQHCLPFLMPLRWQFMLRDYLRREYCVNTLYKIRKLENIYKYTLKQILGLIWMLNRNFVQSFWPLDL